MDLSGSDGVEFDFYNDNPTRFGDFLLRLTTSDGPRSEETGYDVRFTPPEVGKWCHIRLRKVDVSKRHRPCGTWSNVTSVQLIGERGGGKSSACVKLANLRPIRPMGTEAVVVLSESDLKQWFEQRKVTEEKWSVAMTRRMQDAFDELGVSNVAMSDIDLAEKGLPDGVKLVGFVMNGSIPAGAYAVLTNFSAHGGKQLWTRNAPLDVRNYLKVCPEAGIYTGMGLEKNDNVDISAYAGRLEPVLTKLVPAWTSNVVRARAERMVSEAKMIEEIRNMPGKTGETRVLECHRAFGPWPEKEGWDQVAKFAKDCGFTALNVNVCTGPVAWYPSNVLHPAKEVAERGDAVEQLVRAAHANGLKAIGWRCCFRLKERDCSDFVVEFEKAGRLTMDDDLKIVRGFLCPANSLNRQEDVAAFAELAGKGLDVLDMDFIRYSDRTCCCCPTCRAAFESTIGKSIANWPADVFKDETKGGYLNQWRTYRMEVITSHVRDVRAAVKSVNPEIELSCAVFPSAEGARISEGQDWVSWCRRGLVERVTPMNYEVALSGFEGKLSTQAMFKDITNVRFEPSFGPVRWHGASSVVEKALMAARHIDALRRHGYKGYGFFQLTAETKPIIELLAQGPLK